MQDKKKGALEDWMGKKLGKNEVSIFLNKPRRPTFEVNIEGAPSLGPESAKVTIVEYSDFQCPYCAKGSEIMAQLKKKYKGKIKIAFKNFPLPFHNQAKQAAVGAMCAFDQSSELFWKMHDQLFKDQSKLDSSSLKATAKSLGLKSEKFNECLDGNKFMQRIDQDIAEGKKLGIKSTPTFFVNGQLVAGALPVEEFSKLIEEQLAQ
ncbi:DsbA family protein [Bacteriovoracaceae bacterium]|nr:DsbA family protein [Bacteriovoracaceae bacterium]